MVSSPWQEVSSFYLTGQNEGSNQLFYKGGVFLLVIIKIWLDLNYAVQKILCRGNLLSIKFGPFINHRQDHFARF